MNTLDHIQHDDTNSSYGKLLWNIAEPLADYLLSKDIITFPTQYGRTIYMKWNFKKNEKYCYGIGPKITIILNEKNGKINLKLIYNTTGLYIPKDISGNINGNTKNIDYGTFNDKLSESDMIIIYNLLIHLADNYRKVYNYHNLNAPKICPELYYHYVKSDGTQELR